MQLLRRIKKERKTRFARKITQLVQLTLNYVTLLSNAFTRAHNVFGMVSIGHASSDTNSSKICCSETAALITRTRKCLHRAVGLENKTRDTSICKVHKDEGAKWHCHWRLVENRVIDMQILSQWKYSRKFSIYIGTYNIRLFLEKRASGHSCFFCTTDNSWNRALIYF